MIRIIVAAGLLLLCLLCLVAPLGAAERVSSAPVGDAAVTAGKGGAGKKPAQAPKKKPSKKKSSPAVKVTPPSPIVMPESLCNPLESPPPAPVPALLPPAPADSTPPSVAPNGAPAAVEPFFSRDLLPNLEATFPDRDDALLVRSPVRAPLAGVRYRLLPHATLNLGYAPRSDVWSQAARPFGLLPDDLPREERFSFGVHIDF